MFQTTSNTTKSAGVKTIAHPVCRGSRIAYHPRISNADAHAVRIYGLRYNLTQWALAIALHYGWCKNLRDSTHRR